ncbi:hypothetical protein L345_05554, partial [Ophiophagus hannah]
MKIDAYLYTADLNYPVKSGASYIELTSLDPTPSGLTSQLQAGNPSVSVLQSHNPRSPQHIRSQHNPHKYH